MFHDRMEGVSTWKRVAGLALAVDDYALEPLRSQSANFTRATTVVHLRGRGEEGLGEDVSSAEEKHDAREAAGPVQPLTGEWTLADFCAHVGTLDLSPEPPDNEVSRRY